MILILSGTAIYVYLLRKRNEAKDLRYFKINLTFFHKQNRDFCVIELKV